MSTHIVIGLTNTSGEDPSWHYGHSFKHLDQGKPNERITYKVINGGWTASVYKDGRYACNGTLINSHLVVVAYFGYAPAGEDYNEVIYKHMKLHARRKRLKR